MITKRNYIDLLQNRLSGGSTPKDLQKMYGRGSIARVLDFAFNDVCINNSEAAADMSIEYTFTPSSDSQGYFVTLSPQPIAGTLAVFTIYDDKNSYNIQDKLMARGIMTLRGANKFGAILFGNKLRFNTTPVGNVNVTMVPRVSEMGDNDILYGGQVGDAGEVNLFNMILQVLQGEKIQDELNNNAVDSQQQR